MQKLRKSNERGDANFGWLKSKHTFSFGEYYDPEHMGFSVLRVINEDRIVGGSGFGTHPHKDMEIISYVISGALEHKDSMGNATIIRPGEVQRMSAGTGVLHSEYNHLKDQETHFLQIWILPENKGIAPSYGQKDFSDQIKSEKLVLVVSKSGRDGSISMNQDAQVYLGKLQSQDFVSLPAKNERKGWIQVVEGEIEIDGNTLVNGDGYSFENVSNPQVTAKKESHFLFFDLP